MIFVFITKNPPDDSLRNVAALVLFAREHAKDFAL